MGFTSDRNADGEDSLLRTSVRDALRLCERRSQPRFLGFLDERQRVVAQEELRRGPALPALFYGGHPDAERTFLGVFPAYAARKLEDGGDSALWEQFPITALGFRCRAAAELTHRDFLGTLTACGIRRDKLGDILCGKGLSVVFADRAVARFLEGQVERVGGEGVTLLPDYAGELPLEHTVREIRDTVASPRLDAVLKTALGVSREEAARRIEAGGVSVNHRECLSVSAAVREGDLLSVRGAGRFRVAAVGPVSRKGRLFLTLVKYC